MSKLNIMSNLTILSLGGIPKQIGTTDVDLTKHEVKFRCCYPGDSGDTLSTELFNDYKTASKWFDENKEEVGDVHFFACLIMLDSDNEIIDEELIDSFWDEETGL